MVNLRNRSTQRLLALDNARPQASVPVVIVSRPVHLLTTGPVVKNSTIRWIDVDLVHLRGQVECLTSTVAHFACTLE